MKFIQVILIFFLITGSCILTTSSSPNTNTHFDKNHIPGIQNNRIMRELIEHPVIYIFSDQQFTEYNFSGSGSANDPYIMRENVLTITYFMHNSIFARLIFSNL